MRVALGSTRRLWCVVAITVVAAIAIVGGVSSQNCYNSCQRDGCCAAMTRPMTLNLFGFIFFGGLLVIRHRSIGRRRLVLPPANS